ncbi:MAG: hypothetical protein DRN15_02080 [Thermoprotei archaeon]|nr:MAG: hypothetical protein DRN15_02080 [Thermoprotei archaeon]
MASKEAWHHAGLDRAPSPDEEMIAFLATIAYMAFKSLRRRPTRRPKSVTRLNPWKMASKIDIISMSVFPKRRPRTWKSLTPDPIRTY